MFLESGGKFLKYFKNFKEAIDFKKTSSFSWNFNLWRCWKSIVSKRIFHSLFFSSNCLVLIRYLIFKVSNRFCNQFRFVCPNLILTITTIPFFITKCEDMQCAYEKFSVAENKTPFLIWILQYWHVNCPG